MRSFKYRVMTKKLVVFDFCETIFKYQSSDLFVNYIVDGCDTGFRKFYNNHFFKLLKYLYVFAVLYKLFPKLNLEKRLKLFALFGMRKERIEQLSISFNDEIISRNLNAKIIDKIYDYQDDDYTIIVSSGGYNPYLSIFCEEHKIEFLHCTEIYFVLGRCLGIFRGKDCMFDQKRSLLEKLIEEKGWLILKSAVYSDSITDLPLLKWAQRGVVVGKSNKEWVDRHNLEIILV